VYDAPSLCLFVERSKDSDIQLFVRQICDEMCTCGATSWGNELVVNFKFQHETSSHMTILGSLKHRAPGYVADFLSEFYTGTSTLDLYTSTQIRRVLLAVTLLF
jgi:hypothetical protein